LIKLCPEDLFLLVVDETTVQSSQILECTGNDVCVLSILAVHMTFHFQRLFVRGLVVTKLTVKSSQTLEYTGNRGIYEQSLEMYRHVHSENANRSYIAGSLQNLGILNDDLGNSKVK
jgi:hypothetical protein